MQLSLFGLLLLTQPLNSSEQDTRANLEFSSNFEESIQAEAYHAEKSVDVVIYMYCHVIVVFPHIFEFRVHPRLLECCRFEFKKNLNQQKQKRVRSSTFWEIFRNSPVIDRVANIDDQSLSLNNIIADMTMHSPVSGVIGNKSDQHVLAWPCLKAVLLGRMVEVPVDFSNFI